MEISTYPAADGRAVLSVSGELDLAVADNLQEIAFGMVSSQQTSTLCIDMAAVTFMDSTTLAALVAIWGYCREREVALELQDLPARQSRLLEMAGLGGIFELTDSRGGAPAGEPLYIGD